MVCGGYLEFEHLDTLVFNYDPTCNSLLQRPWYQKVLILTLHKNHIRNISKFEALPLAQKVKKPPT